MQKYKQLRCSIEIRVAEQNRTTHDRERKRELLMKGTNVN